VRLQFIASSAITQANEDRRLGAFNGEVRCTDILQYTTIHNLQRESRRAYFRRSTKELTGLVAAGLHHDTADIDITESTIGLCAQFHSIAMAGQHAVADADILAETWRGALQRDAIVVAIGHDAPDDDLMTAVDIQRVVIVVVAIKHLDAVYFHAVTGQVVLHPATRVLQGDILDDDILTLDEADKVRTSDALVVPGEFLEGASSSIDGTKAINHHVLHLVSIDQLDGRCLRAQ